MSGSVDLPSIQTKFPPYPQQQQQQHTPVTALSASFSALSSSSPSPRQYRTHSSPCNSPLLQNTTMSSNNNTRGSFSSTTPSLSSRLSNSSLHSQYSASSDRSLSCSPGPSTPSDFMSRSPSFSYERLQGSRPGSLQLQQQKQHNTLPASFSPLQQHHHRYTSNGIHPFQQPSSPSPSSASPYSSHQHSHSQQQQGTANSNTALYHHGSIPHPATVSRQQPPPSNNTTTQPQQQYHGQGASSSSRDGIYPSSPSHSPSLSMSSRDQEYHHQQQQHHHRRSEPYYHAAMATDAAASRANSVSSPYGTAAPSTTCGSGDYFSRPPTSPSYHPLATPTTPSTAVVVESSSGSHYGSGRSSGPMTPTLPSISTLVAGAAAAAAAMPSPLTPMTPVPVSASTRPHHLPHPFFHHHHHNAPYQTPSSPAASAAGNGSTGGRQGMTMRMILDDDYSSSPMSTMSRSPSVSSDRSASAFSPESSPYLGHFQQHHHARRLDTPDSSSSVVSSPTTAVSTPMVGSAPTLAPGTPVPSSASSSQLLLCPVCSRAFKPSKNQNCNLRRHLKNVHNMSPTMHPRKCKWDSLPDGRVKDDKDRKERTRKSKRLWARKFRLRRKVEEAAVVLSMLSQAM